MKKLFILSVLLFFVTSISFSESIKIVNNDNLKPTKLILKTKNNKDVDVFKVEDSDFVKVTLINNQVRDKSVIKDYNFLVTAPATLELEPGNYTFNMYKNHWYSGTSFEVIANGGTKTWELNPGKKIHVAAGAVSSIGALVTIATGVLYLTAFDDTQEEKDKKNNYGIVAASSFGVTLTSGMIYYIFKPKVKEIK